MRTFAHEVLEVVPFDVVSEVADVDPAVLLRVLLAVVHSAVSARVVAVVVGSVGALAVVAVTVRTLAVDRRPGAITRATCVVTVAFTVVWL